MRYLCLTCVDLLDFVLLTFSASPSMRGSTPLDVAAASVMDNNELALALREPELEKVKLTFVARNSYFVFYIYFILMTVIH